MQQPEGRYEDLWNRVASASGMLFSALALVAFLLTGRPEDKESGTEIVKFFSDHETAVKWQALLFGFAALAFLWFASRIAALLRAAPNLEERIPVVVIAGAAATTALFLAGVAAFAGLAHSASEEGATRALFDLGDMAFGIATFTAAVFVEGVAVGIKRTGILPRWVGVAGGVMTSVLLINGVVRVLAGGDTGAVVGSIAYLLLLAWVFVVSAMLLAAERRHDAAAAAT